MSLPIIALAIAAFGIGTTEFVILGLLSSVAADLNVTIPAAGHLVSSYALGVVVGGPILAVVTARWPRRPTLIVLIGIFLLGNVLCALAPNYWSLMVARVVTAFSHGAFFGIAAVTAASLAVPEKRGQAISLVFAGLTLANVMGVPSGAAIGQAFGWRATFACVVVIGVIAVLALLRWLPTGLKPSVGGIVGEFRVLRQAPVLLALGLSALASVSMFTVVTFIEPMLRDVTGIGGLWISLVMGVYGLGLTAGSILGGRLGHRALIPVLAWLMVGIALSLLVLAVVIGWLPLAVLAIFVWAALSFSIVPLLQLLVVDQAGDAPNLASTLNQSAFNLGNAVGAALGGVVISLGLSMNWIPVAGALVIAVNALLVLMTGRAMRRSSVPESAPA
ncbi:arabinose transporter permease [Saccharospirillum sp. MSK14-1]|uniref:MFS transporter n=1 Tax=Saccharospirillum sp. MSK14-1 TaxID=1897632 RepID=UPI000D39A50B|nr:MFS transporter [Saccharospirillum sp. MSK14-1]PTY38347.1 arabinose transporter permease [Saccharospirillum sp. MSK14-1]